MSTEGEGDFASQNQDRDPGDGGPPLSDAAVGLFVGALVVALVLGYLFLNKMADMSRDEDCALAHRKNCSGNQLSTDR